MMKVYKVVGVGIADTQNKKGSNFLVLLYIFCVIFFLCIWILVQDPYIRKLNYLLLMLYIFVYLLVIGKIRKSVLLPATLIVPVLFVAYFYSEPSSYLANNFLLLLLGLMPFFISIKFSDRNIYWLALFISLIGFLDVYRRMGYIQLSSISILYSSSFTESNIALCSGGFVLYFIARKKWKMFILSLLVSVLFFKRIVILAIVVTILIYLILFRLRIMESRKIRFALVFLSFVAGMVVAVNYDRIVGPISVKLGLSDNILTMGRTIWWSAIKSELYSSHTLELFFGHGIGSAADFMNKNFRVEHPHSDYFRILFDIGVMGSVLLFTCLSAVLSRTMYGSLIALYLAVIMLTDNIIVYTGYLWVFAAFVNVQNEKRTVI